MSRRALFRADASSLLGTGHLVRCMALAAGLTERGWACTFMVRQATKKFLGRLPFCELLLPDELSEDEEILHLSGVRPDVPYDLAVVDHYERSKRFESFLRSWALNILALDDFPHRHHDCDLLLDPTLGRQEDSYKSFFSQAATVLTGPQYALLRPEFSCARNELEQLRRVGCAPRHILLSLGGGGYANHIPAILGGISQARANFTVDLVLGGLDTDMDGSIARTIEELSLPVTLHRRISDMAGLMLEADISIGAAGSTAWERCCLGLPCITVVLADNQQDIASALERAGASLNIGLPSADMPTAVAKALEYLIEDVGRYHDMCRRAFSICDGRGVERTITGIERLFL